MRSLTFVETTEQLVKILADAAPHDWLQWRGQGRVCLNNIYNFWQITYHKRTAQPTLGCYMSPWALWSWNTPCHFIYNYTITAHFKTAWIQSTSHGVKEKQEDMEREWPRGPDINAFHTCFFSSLYHCSTAMSSSTLRHISITLSRIGSIKWNKINMSF